MTSCTQGTRAVVGEVVTASHAGRRGVLLLLALVGLLVPTTLQGQTIEYYHLDALGSVRAVSDYAGVELRRHEFLPFGEEHEPTTPQPDVRLFTGKERDTETALDYFGARYYRAEFGRFTTIDPVTTIEDNLVDPQRWNRYAYARNNPLKYIDPTGQYSCEKSQCDQIESWVDGLNRALGGLERGSEGYVQIQQVLSFIGTNDGKGPRIELARLRDGVNGEAPTGTIRLDIEHIRSEAAQLASFNSSGTDVVGAVASGILAHEARHRIDARARRRAETLADRTRTENNAFWTESYVSEGLGVNTMLWMRGWDLGTRESVISTFVKKAVDIGFLKKGR